MKGAILALSFIAATAQASSWTSHGPIGGSVRALAVAPSDRRVLYVAAADGVFRSGDAGATWANVTGPIDSPAAVVVSSIDPNAVVAAATNGVFHSEDAGATWSASAGIVAPLSPGGPFATPALLIDPRNPSVLYVGIDCYNGAGVYKSTDGGRSFVRSVNGMNYAQVCVQKLALDPAAPDHLFLYYQYQGDVAGDMESDDGAASWTSVSEEAPAQSIVESAGNQRFGISLFNFVTSSDGKSWTALQGPGIPPRPLSLAIDPAVPRLFLGTLFGGYRSGDGGHTWAALDGAARDQVRAIDFDPPTGTLTVGTNFGLFRATPPWSDWSELHIGNSAFIIDQLVPDPSNGDVYAVAQRHLFRSRNLGQSWELIGPPLPGSPVVVDAGHDVYAMERRGTHLWRLRADGTAWDEIHQASSTIQQLVADPQTPGTLYSVEGSIARTRDGGATWDQIATPPGTFPALLHVDPRSSNVLIAVVYGHVAGSMAVLRSVDGGNTWSNTNPGAGWTVYSIVSSSAHPDTIFLVADADLANTLIRSVDGGVTWTVLPNPPPGLYANDLSGILAIDPHDPNVLYLAGYGVMRSVDGGASWQTIDGSEQLLATVLAIDSTGAFLHAGSSTRGVWELPIMPRRRAAGSR